MFEGEARTILPRHESEAADRVVVGNNAGILGAALMRAAACLPPDVQQYQAPGCAPGGGTPCEPLGVTRQTQNFPAGAAGSSSTLTYEFERPFKLAMITIPAANADGFTLTSVKAAGVETIANGDVNGGPFSSGNNDSGGAWDAPWVMPGQKLKIGLTTTPVLAAAVPITVTGATR